MELATKIKLPIRVGRFEINWSTGSPQACRRALTYTLYVTLNVTVKRYQIRGKSLIPIADSGHAPKRPILTNKFFETIVASGVGAPL